MNPAPPVTKMHCSTEEPIDLFSKSKESKSLFIDLLGFLWVDKNVAVNEIKKVEVEKSLFDGFFYVVGKELVKVRYISDEENDNSLHLFDQKKKDFVWTATKKIFICLFLTYFWING